MHALDLLQAKREALQEQYSLLSEKRLELGRSYAIAADPSMQFQLKKQIAQIDAELEELEQRLDQLDRVSQDGRLYQALLKLGYRKQVQVFRKFVQSNPIAAFLIYGASDYGQRWLLNRLVVQHMRMDFEARSLFLLLTGLELLELGDRQSSQPRDLL